MNASNHKNEEIYCFEESFCLLSDSRRQYIWSEFETDYSSAHKEEADYFGCDGVII